MAAKRLAASAVDWAAFVERVPPPQMELFRAFKAKSDGFTAKYVTYNMSLGSFVFVRAVNKYLCNFSTILAFLYGHY